MILTHKTEYADIAQEVECVLGKDEVTSSNLVISSINNRYLSRVPVIYFTSAVNGI